MESHKEAHKKRVLLVEDEAKLARFVELELQYEGYDVDVVNDGRDVLEKFGDHYDLVLLDLLLPGLNGMEIIRQIRRISNVAVIILTAKVNVPDKVTGLDAGADDYITKPFAIEEVLARMRTAFRKRDNKNLEGDKIIYLRDLTVDTLMRSVKWKDDEIDLTKTEFELLLYLVKNKNVVLSREQILNAVWGFDYMGATNVVDVYIRYLRTKIDDRFKVKLIFTTRGVGYYAKE
ncbi:MAG: response regulator transcription factor [Clostridiales bacterium]|jgi:DNA-binding response OmpR family regulator|nr:response regulator transcription factor [Clostridiales bacterium]